jgi:hypothetical protein
MTYQPRRRQSTTDQTNAMIGLALRIVPAIAVFSAIAYALGRLYTEAYYQRLGIPRGVVRLDSADYLFASLEMDVLSITYVLGLWICSRLLVTALNRASLDRASRAPTPKPRKTWNRFSQLLRVSITSVLPAATLQLLALAGYPALIVVWLWQRPSWSQVPGLWGFLVGTASVWTILLLVSGLVWFPNARLWSVDLNPIHWLASWLGQRGASAAFLIVMLAVALLLFPTLARSLGEQDAMVDLWSRLPVSELELPESESATSTPLSVRIVYQSADSIYYISMDDLQELPAVTSWLNPLRKGPVDETVVSIPVKVAPFDDVRSIVHHAEFGPVAKETPIPPSE